MTNSRKSEATLLEQYRVALENAINQPKIAAEMAELSYDAKKITEGQQLLSKTREMYDFNKQEDSETVEASALFKKEKETLNIQFKKHRKKAKAIFLKNPEILKKINIDSTVPYVYTNWIENARQFYTQIDRDILQQLAPLKITQQDITDSLAQIEIVEKARAEYLREVGESQDATKQKDAAIAKMNDWMQKFYAIANIALEEHPQLIEALGKKRKS